MWFSLPSYPARTGNKAPREHGEKATQVLDAQVSSKLPTGGGGCSLWPRPSFYPELQSCGGLCLFPPSSGSCPSGLFPWYKRTE